MSPLRAIIPQFCSIFTGKPTTTAAHTKVPTPPQHKELLPLHFSEADPEATPALGVFAEEMEVTDVDLTNHLRFDGFLNEDDDPTEETAFPTHRQWLQTLGNAPSSRSIFRSIDETRGSLIGNLGSRFKDTGKSVGLYTALAVLHAPALFGLYSELDPVSHNPSTAWFWLQNSVAGFSIAATSVGSLIMGSAGLAKLYASEIFPNATVTKAKEELKIIPANDWVPMPIRESTKTLLRAQQDRLGLKMFGAVNTLGSAGLAALGTTIGFTYFFTPSTHPTLIAFDANITAAIILSMLGATTNTIFTTSVLHLDRQEKKAAKAILNDSSMEQN